ncbi:MAG: YfhO family protein [Acidimicrobiia bacterium]
MRRAAPNALTAWVAVVVFATILLSIGSPLLGDGVFLAVDTLQRYSPWKEEAPAAFRASNPHVTDTIDAGMPNRAAIRRRLAQGDYPLWTSLPAGGRPLAALPNAGWASPLSLPYYVLPLWYAPAAAKLVEMVVATSFTFLFLRLIRIGRPASLVGALIFVNSGFQVVWTNWPQSHLGALIPALFWAVERGLSRQQPLAALPTAVVTAIMLFEGYPAVTGSALLAAGCYAVTRVLAARARPGRDRIVTLASLGIAVLVGLSLAAFQILPFAQWLSTLELGYRQQAPQHHLPISALVTLVIPDAFGSPVDRVYYAQRNYNALQSFIGMGAMVLIGLPAPRWRSRLPGVNAFFWSAALTSLILIYVGGPFLALFQLLPFFGLSSVDRLRSVLGFLLAALAASGFEALVSGHTPAPTLKGRLVRLGVPLVVGAAIAWGFNEALETARSVDREGYFLRQAALPVIVGISVALLVLADRGHSTPSRKRLAWWVIPLLLATESVAFAYPFWPRPPREWFYPVTEAHQFLSGQLGHDRLAAAGRALFPGTTTFYELRSVTAHVFHDPAWRDLLLELDPDAFNQSRTFSFLSARSEVVTSPILDRMAARYFVTSPEDPVLGRRIEATDRSQTTTIAAGSKVTVPASRSDLRAIELVVTSRVSDFHDPSVVRVRLLDASGRTLLGSGNRRIYPGERGPIPIPLVVPPSTSRRTALVELHFDALGGELELAADSTGDPAISLIVEHSDGVKVAFNRGVTIYERERALPRVRWAGQALVVEDASERLERLAAGVDEDAVLLSAAGAGLGNRSVADIHFVEDSGDRIAVSIDATGPGYLVVADALQHGWQATVDGRPAPLLEADHAFVAVSVPQGQHGVELSYQPLGWNLGRVISAVTVLALFLGILGHYSSRGIPRPRFFAQIAAAPDEPPRAVTDFEGSEPHGSEA